jgi:flagellin
MTSLLTNLAAQTALQTLTQTNRNLQTTQSHISTGQRVASAADNAAYWSIATTMRSDNEALSTVEDALGLGSATVDVAYTGIENAIKVASEMKKKLTAAREPGVDRDKIQSEISALQDQMQGVADAAVFSGENWLSVDSGSTNYQQTKSIVSSFTRSGNTISIGTISVDTADVALCDSDAGAEGILDTTKTLTSGATYTVATIDISSTSVQLTTATADTDIEEMIQAVDDAISTMTDAATSLGSVKSRIDLQSSFVSALRDAIDRGVGQLVDADMNEESTKLQALQVQAQLGIQSLSIANQSSQNILALFK